MGNYSAFMVPFGRNGSYEVTFDNHFSGIVQRDSDISAFRNFSDAPYQAAVGQNFIALAMELIRFLCSLVRFCCGRRIMK
ncbi:Uncharacterised protein [Klebsiella grimontii]|uniref:Uncharacterized protein n=1 Tax=Klebsiella grimontii TaxID=2058152 RepID=A0A7H4P953_9ENTR|nr:Uncharacterised protein [Klebsiella grimontii]